MIFGGFRGQATWEDIWRFSSRGNCGVHLKVFENRLLCMSFGVFGFQATGMKFGDFRRQATWEDICKFSRSDYWGGHLDFFRVLSTREEFWRF